MTTRTELTEKIADNLGLTVDTVKDVLDELVEQTGGPFHKVQVEGMSRYVNWTLQHPMSERLEGDLFHCSLAKHLEVDANMADFMRALPRERGIYRVEYDGWGGYLFTREAD